MESGGQYVYYVTEKNIYITCRSTDVWINKTRCICMLGYHLVIKRNDVQMHVTIWVNPENMMLSERGQIQKTT